MRYSCDSTSECLLNASGEKDRRIIRFVPKTVKNLSSESIFPSTEADHKNIGIEKLYRLSPIVGVIGIKTFMLNRSISRPVV